MESDKLQLEGIYRRGFGIVPKFVLHDPALSLESKSIYSYLCALAGGGDTTFPYRETILRQLGITKNTYYRHYTPLVEQGYLAVTRPPDKTAANLYTLVQNPKKLRELRAEGESGRLRYRGLKSHGYGTLPRMAMTDERLSIKAKGLYAYFCSYCGAGDCAFPRKNDILYHLGISEPTYYKALHQLKELGYLEIVQRKEGGRFAVNDYYLCDHPGAARAGPEAAPAKSRKQKPAPSAQPPENAHSSPRPSMTRSDIESPVKSGAKARRASGLRPPTPLPGTGTIAKSEAEERQKGGSKPPVSDTKQTKPQRERGSFLSDPKFWDTVPGDFEIGYAKNGDFYVKNNVSINNAFKNSPSIVCDATDAEREPLGRAWTLIPPLLSERVRKRDTVRPKAQEYVIGCMEMPNGDRLLEDTLLEFVRRFQKRRKGKDIRNPESYFQTSLYNWLAEQGTEPEVRKPRKTGTDKKAAASYDLAELERYIDGGAGLQPSAPSSESHPGTRGLGEA